MFKNTKVNFKNVFKWDFLFEILVVEAQLWKPLKIISWVVNLRQHLQRKAATLIRTLCIRGLLRTWRKHASPGVQQIFYCEFISHTQTKQSHLVSKSTDCSIVLPLVSLRHQRHEKCQNVLFSHRITHSVSSPVQRNKVRWSASIRQWRWYFPWNRR